MANWYVDSNATGAANGTSWTDAVVTVAAGIALASAADDLWVASDHSETQASLMTWTLPPARKVDGQFRIMSVDKTGSVPPVAADLLAGATIETTGDNDILIKNTGYFFGLTFRFGSGAAATQMKVCDSNSALQVYEDCTFKKIATNSNNAAIILDGGAHGEMHWINCDWHPGHTGDRIALGSSLFVWRDTAAPVAASAGGDVTVIELKGRCILRNLDLSSNVDRLAYGGASTSAGLLLVENCKLPASLTDPSVAQSAVVVVLRSHNSKVFINEKHTHEARQTIEETITRTGGASDGTTSIAWKVVTEADIVGRYYPFECLPIVVWNNTAAEITVTVYGIWGGGAVPNDDEIWMEIDYLSAADSPLGAVATTAPATQLTAGSAVGTDSSTWGGSTTAFKLTSTFTPGQVGPLSIRIMCAKVSSTFYIDPKPDVT